MFDAIERTPAVQSLLRRLEKGGLLPLPGACLAAQPFLAAALHRWLPQRPLVVVTDCLKTQESFQQDLETWLQLKCEVRSGKCEAISNPGVGDCFAALAMTCFKPDTLLFIFRSWNGKKEIHKWHAR